MVGTLFMLVCVALITTGGYVKAQKEKVEDDVKNVENKGLYLALTILTALTTGLIFALNTLHMQLVIDSGFDIDQANYDGNLIFSVMLLIIWAIDRLSGNPIKPTNLDFFITNILIFFSICGVILFGNALKYGKAG